MSDLKTQAESLGIKVDGRWSDERIQQEIDAVNASNKPQDRLIPVKVLRDFWDGSGNRCQKGTVVEVSVDDALDGVAAGSFERVKADK
jgi:hypothetical protein